MICDYVYIHVCEGRYWYWVHFSLHIIYFYLIVAYLFVCLLIFEAGFLTELGVHWLAKLTVHRAWNICVVFGCVIPLISGSGVINVHPNPTPGLFVALRIWPRVLRLVWQTDTLPLSHLPSPAFGNFSRDKIVQHSALMCVCVCGWVCMWVWMCVLWIAKSRHLTLALAHRMSILCQWEPLKCVLINFQTHKRWISS